MKKVYLYMLFFSVLAVTGCYDREILESKPGDSIESVVNLDYSLNGSEVLFTWNMPSQYPDDVITPVSVEISVFQDDVEISTITLPDAPTSYTYTDYDSGSSYRFIFKVKADVHTEDLSQSNLRYSEGVVVVL